MEIEEYKEELIQKILILNETLWENRVKRNNITLWLNNFHDDIEKINALFLLSQFMYFGETQMREMLRVLYRDLYKYPIIEKIRNENNDTTEQNLINEKFQEELEKTKFIGVGDASESGNFLLYYFRQENSLSKKYFSDQNTIFTDSTRQILANDSVKHYVFIDDFCGSGSQAKDYSNDLIKRIKELNSSIRISYLMLFSTSKGKNYINTNTLFDYTECVFEFDKSFKCFSDISRYFKGDTKSIIQKNVLKEICEYHGLEMLKIIGLNEQKAYPQIKLEKYIERHKLGFGDCQLLLGMSHNVPNNTLPIFWFNEEGKDWYPIFKRYNKIY